MLVGAHLDNLDNPAEASYARLRAMRAAIVGTMWTDGTRHCRAVYDRLERELDRPVYCLRVGPSGRTTTREWARACHAALDQIPTAAFEERRVRVRALNEVNLPSEGGWQPEEYAAFLGAIRRRTRLLRGAALVSAPLSLGLPDWRDWWQRFVAAAGGAVPAHRIGVNCYAHLIGEAPYFADFGRPVDVTEIGTLELPPGRERGRWLLGKVGWLADRGVESVQAFIVGGRSNGAWDERYVLADEEAEEIGRWREMGERQGEGARPHMAGRGMFVWYLENAERGDLDAIVARARSVGLSYVLIKCGDGGRVWPQFSSEVVAALKADGLAVYGWAYCYGEEVGRELSVAEACFAAGADGYVADVEAEYEGRWREAEKFAAGLAELRPPGKLLGYTPLPVIDYHQSLPYVQFNRVVDVVMPQFYSRALGLPWTPERLWEQWRRWSAQWRAWGVPVPRIVPIGETFGLAEPADIAAFIAACQAEGVHDLAFWEWSQAYREHWQALGAACGS